MLLASLLLAWTLEARAPDSNQTLTLNFLCGIGSESTTQSDAGTGNFLSCHGTNRKLRILVVDYGFVDSMSGASNRHLGVLATLGALGHRVKRAALRVGQTKKLPQLAKGVFRGMQIEQHPKRLLNFKTGSVDEYVSLVRTWDPDLVVMSLWFCGPSLNSTTPGHLLSRHKAEGLRASIVVESSDVHSLREEYLGYMQKRTPSEAADHLTTMQVKRVYAHAHAHARMLHPKLSLLLGSHF